MILVRMLLNHQYKVETVPSMYSLTITEQQMGLISSTFSVIICSICLGLRYFIKDTKKLSWGLTLVNSFVMTCGSCFYIYSKSQDIVDCVLSGNEMCIYNILHSVDDISAIGCIWFALINIADLLFGLMCYRKYLGFLSAIVHHPFYVWIMVMSVTGNGGFITMKPFASAFMLMSIEEVPTFILALGSMFPNYRSDIGFGSSFFVLRICFHSLILGTIIALRFSIASIIILSISLVFHLFWFGTWMRKYGSIIFSGK